MQIPSHYSVHGTHLEEAAAPGSSMNAGSNQHHGPPVDHSIGAPSVLDQPPELDLNLFEEIKENIDKCVRFERDFKEDTIKLEKLDQIISQAEEMANKASEKKEALLKRNLMLKASLHQNEQKIKKSLEYWEDFGLDIRTAEGGYKFIYTKLSDQPVSIHLHSNPAGGTLKIVSQDPEILSNEQMDNLNARLVKYCKNLTIDYKGAMLQIRKDLDKMCIKQ